jgi:hypothetical protein
VYASGGIVLNIPICNLEFQMEFLNNGHVPSQKIAVRAPIIKAASTWNRFSELLNNKLTLSKRLMQGMNIKFEKSKISNGEG